MTTEDDTLADRRQFTLDPAAWDEFQAILDGPTKPRPTLEKLFATETNYDDDTDPITR